MDRKRETLDAAWSHHPFTYAVNNPSESFSSDIRDMIDTYLSSFQRHRHVRDSSSIESSTSVSEDGSDCRVSSMATRTRMPKVNRDKSTSLCVDDTVIAPRTPAMVLPASETNVEVVFHRTPVSFTLPLTHI